MEELDIPPKPRSGISPWAWLFLAVFALLFFVAAGSDYKAPADRRQETAGGTSRSEADYGPRFQNVTGAGAAKVGSGSVVCTTLRGIETMSYNMNSAQLQSIGCIVAGSDIPVKMQDPYSFDPNQKVQVYLPKEVLSYWVRMHSLKDRTY